MREAYAHGMDARDAVIDGFRHSGRVVVAAALSHVVTQGVTWSVLIPLVLGGTPGTYLGARLSKRVAPSVVRGGIVIVLTMSGVALLDKAGVDPSELGDRAVWFKGVLPPKDVIAVAERVAA